ncbi:MAG TPA: TIGR03619 family F420-dependent LLM class oxidoreductase [Acidimicrobiales bacterium]
MRFGLFGINVGVCAREPAEAVRVAVTAEAAGWESVWTGEHYVLPDPVVPTSPARPGTPMLDPFVALTNVAARTTTLLLGTGVTVVPLHAPVILAKKVASLDRVSGGRFLFGVGVGYLAPEFRAVGVPLAGRGARMDDHLDAMVALWTSDGPAVHDGPVTAFDDVRAEPPPVQQPHPPLHVGGYAPEAYRRAVTRGRGWYGYALDPAGTERALVALRRAEADHERPAELGPLEVSITPDPGTQVDEATVAAYAELGVDRLIALPPRGGAGEGADAQVRFVEEVGERVIARPGA